MATVLLQTAGAALGSVFGPVGAVIGRAAGALAGSMIDRSLLGGTTVNGARLSSARLTGASEGTAIPRLYGTARLGGTLIWATRFEEETVTERAGGKASGTRTKSYRYFANLALALCEGEVSGVRRVWADGRELDLTAIEMRVYRGVSDQPADPLILARQGETKVPAYRGLAYVVFERLPLDDFGNRIPLLQFEVIRAVGELESRIRAVTVIPGATEHGYATVKVSEQPGDGEQRFLNRNTLTAETGRPRSTSCRRCAPTSNMWRWWSPGSAPTSGPGNAGCCPVSRCPIGRGKAGAGMWRARGAMRPMWSAATMADRPMAAARAMTASSRRSAI